VNLNHLRSNGARATLTSLNIYDSSSGHPVDQIIDRMGMASSKAQMLATTITTAAKFFSSSDQKLYFKTQGTSVIGFLKTGRRTLFQNRHGDIKEIRPLCVLDFYVHESVQRGGHGKAVFELMLRDQNVTPD
jgi:alpha-tubulin N-acetyltransferase 1